MGFLWFSLKPLQVVDPVTGLRIYGLVTSLLLMLLLAVPVAAQSGGAQRAKLDAIVQQLKEEQQALNKVKGQERSLLSELERMERRLSKGVKRLAEIRQEDQRIRHTLPTLNARIDSRKMAMARQQQLLAGHLRLFYGMEGKEALRILAPQRHSKATMQNMVYFRYLIEARNARFTHYKKSVESLQEAITEQQLALATLQRLAKKELELRVDLERERAERSNLLNQVRRERRLHARKVEELKEAQEALTRFVSKLDRAIQNSPLEIAPRARTAKANPTRQTRTPSFKKIHQMKGRLPKPVQGHSEAKDPGLFFDVPQGAQVRAIHRAQIVYADWFRGYGQLLILNHGENVYSLYGHNSRLLVAQGDWVEEGDLLAEVGNTGALDGRIGLYFEIRNRGKTVNARRWLVRRGR
ncbi:murein hydrolase activator EnvC family protein [Magnetococcus sp. PR-3]|uniref:murein hydrolase activator EnvC family protein n=1 Tax=Magnetococcus sp. PR-3 TaxID=3120355 RepID=UPI002FCE12D7